MYARACFLEIDRLRPTPLEQKRWRFGAGASAMQRGTECGGGRWVGESTSERGAAGDHRSGPSVTEIRDGIDAHSVQRFLGIRAVRTGESCAQARYTPESGAGRRTLKLFDVWSGPRWCGRRHSTKASESVGVRLLRSAEERRHRTTGHVIS